MGRRGKALGYLRRGLVLAVLAFFAYTLVNKALDLTGFQLNIAKTGIFAGELVVWVSYLALALEGISIVLLLVKEQWGGLFSLCMMLAFTAYIVVLQGLGRYEICGCGGILNGLPFAVHLAINLGLLAVLAFLLWGYGRGR